MSIANSHHEHLSLDCIRAYHFGARFIVELEVLLPAQMTVEESHDIALFLQHKVSIYSLWDLQLRLWNQSEWAC